MGERDVDVVTAGPPGSRSYNVVLSSSQFLVKLEEMLGRPLVVYPQLTEVARLSGRSRSKTHHTQPQFPGYGFLDHDHQAAVHAPRLRARVRLLRHPGTGDPVVVGQEQLEHALWLEEQTACSPLPPGRSCEWRVGDRALLARGPLAAGGGAALGTVREVRGSRLVLWLDGCAFPVSCSAADVETV